MIVGVRGLIPLVCYAGIEYSLYTVIYQPLYMTMCLGAERGEASLADTSPEVVGFEDLL